MASEIRQQNLCVLVSNFVEKRIKEVSYVIITIFHLMYLIHKYFILNNVSGLLFCSVYLALGR